MKTKTLFALFLISGLMVACVSQTDDSGKQEAKQLKPATTQVEHLFGSLPYAYDALEPYIDARTMEIHYDRHHRAYYNNFINAIKGSEIEKMPLGELFDQISLVSTAIRNNAGGYYNHNLFWEFMAPGGNGEPSPELTTAINDAFGGMDVFKDTFGAKGLSQFGSGWAWLIVDENGKLAVTSTANQDNPLMDVVDERGTPILALDVWEHAYYLQYQNRRADYVSNFWQIVNWEAVNQRYAEAVR
jgi:superoxide dismutase, Fe-Mn family